MKTVVHNPSSGIYTATPDYAHAVELRNVTRPLYVSGTMGLDEHGVAAQTLVEQLELIWSNIRVMLASADMSVANIVRVTSYLRDPAYMEDNQNARVAALEGRAVPTTTIVVQTLVSSWLVEIEIIAAA